MDKTELSKDILRSTEILLTLIHEQNQFSDCSDSLKRVEAAIETVVNELRDIFIKYKKRKTHLTLVINNLLDCTFNDSELFRTEDEERVADKLVFAFSINLLGCIHLVEIYDYLNRDSHKKSKDAPSVLSIKQETTIRLSFGYTFKLCFRHLLKTRFGDWNKLLPVTGKSDQSSSNTSSRHDVPSNIHLCSLVYKTFLQYFMNPGKESNIRILSNFHKDCSVILIACRIFFMTRQEFKEPLKEVHEDLNRFSQMNCNKVMFFRDLFVLRNSKPNQELCVFLNRFISQTIQADGGIETLVEAILESDPMSEDSTTITTRVAAIASILVLLPVNDPVSYHKNLISQALKLLQTNEASSLTYKDSRHGIGIYWRVSAQVLDQIVSSQRELANEAFTAVLQNCLNGQCDSQLGSINSCIEVLSRIINCAPNFPIETFYVLVRPILLIRFAMEKASTSPLKSTLDNVLRSLLQNIPQSVYLLDEVISFSPESSLNKYKANLDSESLQYNIVVQNAEQNFEDEFFMLESFGRFISNFVKKLSNNYLYDLFFLLLEKVIGQKKNVVSLVVLSYLGEILLEQSDKINESDEKELLTNARRLRFLSSTFERIVTKIFDMDSKSEAQDDVVAGPSEDDDDDIGQFGLFHETLKICISILVVIVEKLEQIPVKDKSPKKKEPKLVNDEDALILENIESIERELRIFQDSLKKLLTNRKASDVLDPLERYQAEILLTKLNKILDRPQNSDENKTVDLRTVNKALEDLKEPLMPVRAHGLIVIKQLVQCRDPSIDEKFDTVLTSIKELLLDCDSYLYLAAVNALGAMAVRYTDRILPLLLDELIGAGDAQSEHRAMILSDRHKVGEVLMQLAKSIGDFAYHYADMFIGKLLLGVKNENATIRVSSLVCLGKYCRNFKYGLSAHIVELVFMGERLLTTDRSMDVRRAAADFFRQLVEGLDGDNIWLVQDHIKPIKDALLKASVTTLDDTLQLHCSLAFDELSRISAELLKADNKKNLGIREIK